MASTLIDRDLEPRIQSIGRDLWKRTQGKTPGIFDKGFWQGRMMDWAMRDPSFKLDLFRFVDVLPTLGANDQLTRHLKEYLIKDGRELGVMMGAALKIASGGLGFGAGLAANQVRKNVTDMAHRFIVGQDARGSLKTLRLLHDEGFAFTVDLLGEATISPVEADAYQARVIDLIDTLANEVPKWPSDPRIDSDDTGPIPRVNVSLKASAFEPHLDPVDPAGSVERLLVRVLPLFQRAKARGVFINVDLEQWSMNRITYDLFERVLLHESMRGYPHVGIVVQGYLLSAKADAERMLALAQQRGLPITIRLVKGAYWDYEVAIAAQTGYPCPVFTDKAATDQNYESLSRFLLENRRWLRPALASHNLRSVANAIAIAESMNVPRNAYEIQMLYGMAEPERAALRDLGNRVRIYAPVGELLPGMAYLVRRLLENTANSGFLKISHHDGADISALLASPKVNPKPVAKTATFVNCPLTDFSDRAKWKLFDDALKQVAATLPRKVSPFVADAEATPEQIFKRESPNDLKQIVANVGYASAADARRAVETATAAFPAWRDRPLADRATMLNKLADKLAADRYELAAMQCYEVGKPWKEADADVAEAVDFCRYYARQALVELSPQPQGNVSGEANLLMYEGRGPTVVIAPWNFPLAILCGMATAALVAGNPVILKPAEQSSAVGLQLYERMIAAGFDCHVVQFLPGDGAVVGKTLVAHPNIANIVFTGSQSVGLQIFAEAGKVVPGQFHLKRVVCEMGGKNAIIIDDDADLDEAVLGVAHSAFGFSGQKCSACSRVVVLAGVYDAFCKRLVEACRALHVVAATDPACQVGPVIDREAHERLKRAIETSSATGGARALFVNPSREDGYYVGPAVFEVTDESSALMRDELFGPVVALAKADSFEAAIQIANRSAYKLTGAVYSRSPVNLEMARQKFRVGNLYLNRGSTGAMVGRQPFGGFGMSGGGTKAGGPGYLLNFVDPRVVTENTMRRGLTPELAS